MAEPAHLVDKALKKLEDQLTCPICFTFFTNPKPLQCFHIYCRGCLEQVVDGDQSICCPKCRQTTLLPANGLPGLQSAFHVSYLFEIQDILKKIKLEQEGQKTPCDKCTKRDAKGFCCDCGFVCEICIEVHESWTDFSNHRVISLERLKIDATKIVPPIRRTLYCSTHPGKELDLYCETDKELICRDCIVRVHRDHQYDLVSEAFPKHHDTLVAHLEPIKHQLVIVKEAIHELDRTQQEIATLHEKVESDIQKNIEQLCKALERRGTKLLRQLNERTQTKKRILSMQRDELEMIETRFTNCLQFASDSLKTGSKAEILAVEHSIVQQVQHMSEEFNSYDISPQELPDMTFVASSDLISDCEQFGQVHADSRQKCPSTDKGLNVETQPRTSLVTIASPRKFNVPNSIIAGLNGPWGIVINKRGQTIIAECKCHSISIYGLAGEVIKVFGRKGLAPGEFYFPRGVALDAAAKILVVDGENHRIQKFTAEGNFMTLVGSKGYGPCQFRSPSGIGVNNYINKVYICDSKNHRVQILNQDLSFFKTFGNKGNIDGQFNYPLDVSFDSDGQVYIADSKNHRIQVFTPNGRFIRKFSKKSGDAGGLNSPACIAIDSDNGVVYIGEPLDHCVSLFNVNGDYLTSFDTSGKGLGQSSCPQGLAVDKGGLVYVSDHGNNCLQLW